MTEFFKIYLNNILKNSFTFDRKTKLEIKTDREKREERIISSSSRYRLIKTHSERLDEYCDNFGKISFLKNRKRLK